MAKLGGIEHQSRSVQPVDSRGKGHPINIAKLDSIDDVGDSLYEAAPTQSPKLSPSTKKPEDRGNGSKGPVSRRDLLRNKLAENKQRYH